MVRRIPSKHRNTPVAREPDHSFLIRLGLLLVCGLLLAGGFVYAGGRHFAALTMGYETQKLRTDLENAREEQRRLLLEREAAASPARLERAARQLGLQPMQPGQFDPLKTEIATAESKTGSKEEQSAAKVASKLKPDQQTQDLKNRR